MSVSKEELYGAKENNNRGIPNTVICETQTFGKECVNSFAQDWLDKFEKKIGYFITKSSRIIKPRAKVAAITAQLFKPLMYITAVISANKCELCRVGIGQ